MGTKSIINAVRENNPEKLQDALDFYKNCIDEDYDLNQAVQKNKQRLLHIATSHGNEKICLYLLEKGADINITDSEGNTPAHYAVIYAKPNILKLLKETGADFSKKNNYGCTLERYIQTNPKKEKNKIIKKEFESILMEASFGLTMLADVAIKYAEIPSKIEKESKQIYFNKVQATHSSFFHNLPREFEYQTEPLNLTKHDKPLDLSITPCFK